MQVPGRGARIRPGLVWVVAGLMVAAVAGLAVAALTGGMPGGSSTQPTDSKLAGLTLAKPLMNGRRVSLASAPRLVGFSVPVPATSIASRADLTATWAVANRRQVALVFDRGAVTIMMKRAGYRDPARQYRTYVIENHVTAAVGRVHGQPVLVISRHTDRRHDNPAWVEFDVHGTDVNVTSARYSAAQLLRVARSMTQTAGA
jgi:hypothetical protein